MNLHIRPLSITDIAAIHEIEQQSFSDPWTKRMFFSELVSRGFNHSRVAVDAATGQIIGYCLYWILPGDEVHINNIAVHPSHRNRGIGNSLLREAMENGRRFEIHGVTLEVRESNTVARKFYERLGFEEVGRRVKYYCKPKEDALILRLFFNRNEKGHIDGAP
jgi:ribosomal-protein-alanine N-acetyltransferase